MKVLFVGGTGTISSGCSALAVERGIELTLLNRGRSKRPAPAGARVLQADIRDPDAVDRLLGREKFDAVVDFLVFLPAQLEADLRLFRRRTEQYVFISSASAYQSPPSILPVTESTPLQNPYWDYSREKAACEELLLAAYRRDGFPMTIVRPSHTYDEAFVPVVGGWTVVDRMRRGRPIIVHGDGTSLWVLTHNRDFAVGLVGLLGNPHAIGQSFGITSDEWLDWNAIHSQLAAAAGVEPHIVHVPSDLIAAYDPEWGAELWGDKTPSMVFDCSKLKRVVPEFSGRIPFRRGAEEIIAWHDADPRRQQIDAAFNATCEHILEAYRVAWPGAAPY